MTLTFDPLQELRHVLSTFTLGKEGNMSVGQPATSLEKDVDGKQFN